MELTRCLKVFPKRQTEVTLRALVGFFFSQDWNLANVACIYKQNKWAWLSKLDVRKAPNHRQHTITSGFNEVFLYHSLGSCEQNYSKLCYRNSANKCYCAQNLLKQQHNSKPTAMSEKSNLPNSKQVQTLKDIRSAGGEG